MAGLGEPLLPPDAKKTYSIKAPRETHWRTASCAEVECEGREHGWVMLIDETTELGQRQAHYIRKVSGRRFRAETENGLTSFTFEPGQTCFTEHEVPLGKPELYVVRDGDLRETLQQVGQRKGNVRVHTRPEDWADDFATHQQKIADAIQEG
ncbi:hypothetical protein VA596_41705 [Amycolatopsis sp., V23-08]|uniref:Uncharacterized protein n=1 Tax=Amycolatopsis heterodermiae TaxID=3110235 RepID=A0ABU5RII9_9PSEU|nr:hypothetical protein [Amycolatopsis sp., V23-08]MEA5366103.1 hypothetical protein [Amycolatopsis sp., V23-08]